MDKPKFVYVTYIRTTPEKLWQALIDPNSRASFGARPGRIANGNPVHRGG